VTLWDAREAGRSMGFAALALVLAWLVSAATDEGGVAWTTRAERTLPLAPACAALGTWLGQGRAWAKGEARALAALGRSPLATSAPAVLGGACVAWAVGAAISLSSLVGVAGFFPVARAPVHFVSDGDGVFVDGATGYRVERDGTLVAPAPGAPAPRAAAASDVPPEGRLAAALVTCALGIGLPLLVARAARAALALRLGVMGVAAFAATILLQASAARAVGALWATVPALAVVILGGVGLLGAGRPSWRPGS
jgi:hypothetical protein